MADPLTEELNRAAAGGRREVLPLDYAARRSQVAPFDWPGTIRQVIFACGVAFLLAGVCDIWGSSYDLWRDNGILWVSFGAGMAALAMPWPGRIGRKK
jgi:hypothetical protein